MAFNLKSLNSEEIALDYAEKAIKTVDRAFPKSERFEKTNWISSYYSAVKQYKTAITYKRLDLLLAKDTLSILKLYNDIGFYFYRNNQLDSAIHYFEKIIHQNINDEKLKGIIGLATGNLGAVYIDKKEYLTALEYLKIDSEISKDRNVNSYYNAVNSIGECHFLIGDYYSAIKALDILKQLEESDLQNIQASSILKTYKLYMDSYAEINDSKKSLSYMRKFMVLKDSIANRELPYEQLYKEISKYKINLFNKDMEIKNSKIALLESEQQKTNIQSSLMLIAIVLFLVTKVSELLTC